MSVKDKTFQVVAKSAVMVETPDGNAMSYPAGQTFIGNPLNPHIVRLLRINAIREVSAREIPNFNLNR
jgi:hypothetical protein